jgi:ATP synthase protein I
MLLGRRAFSREGATNVMVGPRGGRQLNALAKLASVGIEFSVSTLIGLLGGRWLDGKLGTAPWLMLVGLVLGVTAGLRSLLRTARRANEESSKAHDNRDD